MQLGLCCSSLQHALVTSLAQRLERNLGLSTLIVEDDAAPVGATWDQASACDAVLLLLDSVSAPSPVKRDDWETLIEHPGTPPVAMLRLGPCHYPKLLERRLFIASEATPIDAERWVERWLVKMLPRQEEGIDAAPADAAIPDEWWRDLVDTPGTRTASVANIAAAQALAHQARGHFQGVFWIGCRDRPAAVILGEIEHRSRAEGRLLFVLISPPSHLDLPAGRHSYLLLEGVPETSPSIDPLMPWIGVCQDHGFSGSMLDMMLGPRTDWEPAVTILDRARRLYRAHSRHSTHDEAEQRHLTVLEETFRLWRNHPSLCDDLIGEAATAVQYGFRRQLALARDLCLYLSLFLLAEKRHTEAVVWLRALAEEADRTSDLATARRARHELSWLIDEAGDLRHDVGMGPQLTFDFGG